MEGGWQDKKPRSFSILQARIGFWILAPFKRVLSTKNTSPSQKMRPSFFCRTSQVPNCPYRLILPVFFNHLCLRRYDLLPGTHQDQGRRRETIYWVAERRDPNDLGAEQTLSRPLVQENGPQKNIGTLPRPRVVTRQRVPCGQTIEGSRQGQIAYRDIRLGLHFEGVQRLPTKLRGFPPPLCRELSVALPNY